MSSIHRTAYTDLTITPDGLCQPVNPEHFFDAEVYSRLKYGSAKYLEEYGTILGKHLLEQYESLLLSKEAPVAVVVYQVVPPACNALTIFAMDAINQQRKALNLEPGTVVRIHKGEMLTKEYAAESPEVRQQILDSIHFDTLDHDFNGRVVLFLDDVRITGTTEAKVCSTVAPHKPKDIICGYIAQFDEREARADPAIESRMNSSFVHSLADISDVIAQDGFILNIRVLKRILRTDEYTNLAQFLAATPVDIIAQIDDAALESGLSDNEAFSKSSNAIKKHREVLGLQKNRK